MKLRSLLVTAAMTLLGVAASAQTVDWSAIYASPNGGPTYGERVVMNSDGGVITASFGVGGSGTSDFIIQRYTANGERLWATLIDRGGSDEYPESIAIDGNGAIYVTGTLWPKDGSYNRWFAVRLEQDGAFTWQDSLLAGSPKGIVPTDSGFVATGYVFSRQGGDMMTVRYEADSSVTWRRRFDAGVGGEDSPTGVAKGADGSFYVSGYSEGPANVFSTKVIKYSPSGTRLWVRAFAETGMSVRATHIAALPAGGCAITGNIKGTEKEMVLTQAYDANGALLWRRRYSIPFSGSQIPMGIGVDAAGNVYVAADAMDTDSKPHIALIKYGLDGTMQWSRRYLGSAASENDAPISLAVSAAGDVYLTGVQGEVGNKSLVLRYRTDGRLMWIYEFDGSTQGLDTAMSCAVDDNGVAYVVGSTVDVSINQRYALIFKIH